MLNQDLKQIHKASMKVLEETGVKLYHSEILELVKKNGVRVEGETAFFNEDQIMKWVKKAPSSFTLYARNPKYNMVIGGNNVEYAPGFGSPMIADFDGVKRQALFSDYINFCKLVHQCPYFNVNGGILVQPSDLDMNKSSTILLCSTIAHSDKCLMSTAWGGDEANKTIDVLGIVFGGKESLKNKPRILSLINTNSPLQLTKTALETLMVYAKNGQPVIITPGPMAGTTGPITLAGHFALANAEALAGIAIAQMINPGTPVVYGVQGSITDMKSSSSSTGAPESALIISYCAKLAKFYGLPCRSGGVRNDAKSVDVQSGYESMMMMLVTRNSGINYIIHSAGILDSFLAMSYEKFIIDIEIIAMVERFLKGIDVNEASLAVDLINQIGPGGQFMATKHTVKRCRTEHWIPDVSIKGSLHNKKPTEKILDNIMKKKDKMLNSYVKPELEEHIYNNLINYLNKLGIDLENLIK